MAGYRAAGVKLVFGSQETNLLDGMDVVVPSPVISPEIPIMKEAIRRGLPIWSEVEVACRVTDADVIGITGTNGKTTTTTLVGEIMKATGRQTVVGGNIGYGLSAQADNLPEEAVVVAELSSFQLEFTHSIKAKAATILNITPDHLDRHHTMEAMPLPRNASSSIRTRAIMPSSITTMNGSGPWRET